MVPEDLEWDLRISIFNKFPGDMVGAALGNHIFRPTYPETQPVGYIVNHGTHVLFLETFIVHKKLHWKVIYILMASGARIL
jgi:hypothetical protein